MTVTKAMISSAPQSSCKPAEIGCAAAESEYRAQIARPAFGHHCGGDREFQDQIPADDPRDELTEGRVRERVGAACHRHRRGELRVAQRGQAARDGGEDERYRDRRPGDVARRGRSDREDAGPDHHRYPEDGEVPPLQILAQAGVRLIGVGDRLLHRLRPPPSGHESSRSTACTEYCPPMGRSGNTLSSSGPASAACAPRGCCRISTTG